MTDTDTVPVSTGVSAEAVIAQLRNMQARIEDSAPLTKEQRTQYQQYIRNHPRAIVEATINVIGVLDNLSKAIGQPFDQIRQLQDDTLRWEAVVEEARAFLKGIEGANLLRRERLARIAMQAYTIGFQLARDPANAALIPHIEEVKRLKDATRRRRAGAART